MAESVVSFLLDRLSTWIDQEVELLQGVGEEVRDIRSELQVIRAFLKDADARSESDAGVKEWVTEVRNVAFEIEDVLDGLLLPNNITKNAFRGMVDFFRCATLKTDHKIGNEIKAIKVRIDRISQRKERYNLCRSEQQSSTSNNASLSAVRDPREDALFIEESQIVGIDGPRDNLITYLLDVDPKLRVVAVYGMGGLGKTTLVKKVYDNQRLKGEFQSHRAWITVSETFDVKDLLRKVIEQLLGQLKGLDKMDATVMKQKLNDKLRGKRYVVVLDDIWSLNAWKGLKNALPDDNCGSVIIITTRFENIAAEAVGVSGLKYPLEPLNLENSRRLFYKKAFKSNVPERLSNDPCSKFLKKCNGLPLGIVAIAGLLSTKQPSEWDQVYQSLGTLMDGSIDRQLEDLRLVISYSFNDLPYHLKSCFMYMSIFPEDYSIHCSTLFQLWAAEVFVLVDGRPGMNFTKEELARFYLNELIQRSLVQVETTNDRTRVRSCKLHDLMREFIIGKANNENFANFISEGQNSDWSCSGRPQRRLSVATEMFNASDKSALYLRSLFLFPVFSRFEGFSRFKLLKVLYLDHEMPGNNFFAEIGTLSNLRYLRLRCYKLEGDGSFLGKLLHLETLDLKGINMRKRMFPGILKMRQLRILRIGPPSIGRLRDQFRVILPVGIHELTKLEKLGVVDLAGEDSGLFVSELGKMTQLRKLRVRRLRQEDEMQLFASVGKMKFLKTFKVAASYFFEYRFLHSGRLSSPPLSLQSLSMLGALNPLPPWMSSLQNLEKLVLSGSELKDDPMQELQQLPCLVTLILYQAFDGEKLCFAEGGFPSLKKLFLLQLEKLNEVKVEQGAIPVLKSITHAGCDFVNFDELPLQMGHRTTLPEIIHDVDFRVLGKFY